MLKSIAADSLSKNFQKDLSQTRLERTCVEFETIFINYIMKSARSSIAKIGIADDNREGEIIKSMFDERLADKIAKGGGIGLGSILFERLKDRI